MKLAAVILSLSLAVAAQDKPKRYEFWPLQLSAWSAMLADGFIGGTNPARYEANSWYVSNGRYSRGRYFAINLPVTAALSFSAYRMHKRSGRIARALADSPAAWQTVIHTKGALSWCESISSDKLTVQSFRTR